MVVYTHKTRWRCCANWRKRIHRAEALEIYAIDRALLAALAERLERRMVLALAVTDRHLFVTLGEMTMSGDVTPLGLA